MVIKQINIAIDGVSGSGKGSSSKFLAKKINYKSLDSGAIYRAVAIYLKEKNINTVDEFNEKNENILQNISIKFNEKNEIILNNKNIEKEIRNEKIAKLASDFSTIKIIREIVTKKQQEIVINKGYILEGRDIASTVIPNAELKIFLNADINIRAKRRLIDQQKQNLPGTFEEIKNKIKERDYQDINRKLSPLVKTKDAIEIDTSNLNIKEQVNKIYELYLKIINK